MLLTTLPSARGTSLCWLLSWPCVPTSFFITWTLKAGIPWDSVPPNTSFLIPQAHSFVIVAYVTIHAPRIPKFRCPPQFSVPNSWPSYPQRHFKINKPQTELMSSPQPGPVLLFRSHGNGAGWRSRKCEMQTAWPQTNHCFSVPKLTLNEEDNIYSNSFPGLLLWKISGKKVLSI